MGLAIVTLCILASANAREMFRRSPQDAEIDHCAVLSAWRLFCAFDNFCNDGTFGKCEGGTRGEKPDDAFGR